MLKLQGGQEGLSMRPSPATRAVMLGLLAAAAHCTFSAPRACPQVALVAVMVAHLQEGMAQAGTLVHVQQTGEEFRRRHRRLQSAL